MARKALRILVALAYLIAGVAHLRSPDGFLQITPHWVPLPEAVVALTGVAEIAGAISLMIPRLRYAAGVGLALYALCVFPANINHALNDIAIGGRDLSWWYHGPRLVLQPVIIWLALWVGHVTDWPFRKSN
jgi:uncharacterized membrane protein